MFFKRLSVLFDEVKPPDAGGGAGGGAATPPVVPPAAPAAKQQPLPVTTDGQVDPNWLNPRLEQARSAAKTEATKDLLKSLGYASEADAKAALDAGKAAQQASLTQQERDAARIKELEPLATKTTALEATLKGYADKELAGLTDAQRTAVAAIAGDDTARILTTIEQLRPTWGAAPPVVTPPVAPPPATTVPLNAPPPPAPADPASPRTKWEAMKKTDPTAASIFYQTNRAAIEAAPA